MKDLKKLVETQKRQAQEIVDACYRGNDKRPEGFVHPVLLKAVLNGLNAAAGSYTSNMVRFARMVEQLEGGSSSNSSSSRTSW